MLQEISRNSLAKYFIPKIIIFLFPKRIRFNMRMQSQFFDDCNNLSSMGIPSLGSASFGGMPSGTFFQVIPSNNSVVDNTTEMGGLVYANSMDFPLLTHRSSGRIDVFSSLSLLGFLLILC